MKYQVLFSHDEPHGTIDAGIIAEGSGNDGGLAAGTEGIGLEMLPQGVEEDITGTGLCNDFRKTFPARRDVRMQPDALQNPGDSAVPVRPFLPQK